VKDKEKRTDVHVEIHIVLNLQRSLFPYGSALDKAPEKEGQARTYERRKKKPLQDNSLERKKNKQEQDEEQTPIN